MMSFFKIVFTVASSFVLGYVNMGQKPKLENYFQDGWDWSHLTVKTDLIWYFLGNLVGGIIGKWRRLETIYTYSI